MLIQARAAPGGPQLMHNVIRTRKRNRLAKATRADNPLQYYFFLVISAASAVVFGMKARSSYETQIALDRLPDRDFSVLPWYLFAVLSLAWVVILILAIERERVV
jgi:hypothetical protein